MYVDKNLLLSNEQAMADDAVSEFSIDLATLRDVGAGRQLYVVICVDVSAHASDSSKTVTFRVVTSTSPALAAAQVIVASTDAITGSALTAGRVPIVMAIPPLLGNTQLYLGLDYEWSTTGSAGLKVTAFVAIDATTNY